MSTTEDYVPSRHNEFNDWQTNMVTLVVASAVAWGIAPAKVTALTDQQTIYQPFYDAIANPSDRTKAKNSDHKDARKVYQTYLRKFVKENLRYNTVITSGEKELLGLNPGNNAPGSRPPILTVPHLTVMAKGNLLIIIECRVEGDSTRPSIHPDADGVEIVGIFSLTPPASYEEALKIGISTKARFNHIHDVPADSGKNVYLFARWVNISDPSKNGPWSDIASTRFS